MKQNMMGGRDKLRTVVPYTQFSRGKIFAFFLGINQYLCDTYRACSFPLIGKLKPTLLLELHVWPWPKKQKAESAFSGGVHSFLFRLVFLMNSSPDVVVSFWMDRPQFLHQFK